MSVPVQAAVLAAGEGRRLRPFTEATPKPLLPLLNVPVLRHTLVLLARSGVRRVCLNAWHRASQLEDFAASDPVPGLELTVVREERLLGTGGGLGNMRAVLEPGPVLVMACDVLGDFDLAALSAAHRRSGAEATMALTSRADPAVYGAVEVDDDGFLTDIVGLVGRPGRRRCVNASAYVLEWPFMERLPTSPACLVRDGFVPALAAGARCAGFVHAGVWYDTGTPAALLEAQRAALAGRLPVDGELLREGGRRRGDAFVHAAAQVAEDAELTGGTTVGAGAQIGAGARLDGCLVLPGARVAEGARCRDAIVDGASVLAAGGEP